jgi:predicted DNA-binding protein YlxM (UPF0122 family)
VINLLERTVEITLLFDYYGELLTEKQQKTVRLYYFMDLSLKEVADRLDISRQGVYDHLQRAENLLREYEEKLNHVNRYRKFKNSLDELYEFTDQNIENENSKEELLKKINDLKESL